MPRLEFSRMHTVVPTREINAQAVPMSVEKQLAILERDCIRRHPMLAGQEGEF